MSAIGSDMRMTALDPNIATIVPAQEFSKANPPVFPPTTTHFPRPSAGPFDGGIAMSMSIEDLARDRVRQIRADSEVARQVRRARAARKAASRG